MKKTIIFAVGIALPLIRRAESAAPKPEFSLKIGPAFGYLRKGFVNLRVAWSASATGASAAEHQSGFSAPYGLSVEAFHQEWLAFLEASAP
jgi:hypothetical protein